MKVSGCCHREIIKRHGMEFPLGGSTWGISYTYDACECCGKEVEEYVETCEECGEVVCDSECSQNTVRRISKTS